MELTANIVLKMIRSIQATQSVEIGCDECFKQLNQFAELELAGKKPGEAMPLIKNHLNRCKSCKEEFEALLIAMETLTIK